MAKKWILGRNGRQWLKSLHLIVSVIWLGAAISMNLLRYGWAPAASGDLYAVDHSIAVIDNLVVVPHIASASVATRQKMSLMAAQNLIAGLKGERLPNCVNPEVYTQGD